jgi:GH25 family lysozyme M1 (1,4-beta-N-acetylmuramidase)
MSNGNRVRGIDVSLWRGAIQWSEVPKDEGNIRFAITKATDGIGWTDPTFDVNWVGMRRAGLVRGSFHFYQPGIDAEAQADYYLGVMDGLLHDFDLPLILDVEPTKFNISTWGKLSSQEHAKRLRRCLDRIHAGSGRKPILYTNPNTWQTYFKHSKAFTDYPLWLANYTDGQPLAPAENWGGKGWTLWQFTEDGTARGVNPPVDVNWFNGSMEDMRRVFNMQPLPAPPEHCSNRELVAAFIKAAKQLNLDFDDLLRKARLLHIHRGPAHLGRLYDGLAINDLPVLSAVVKAAVKAALGIGAPPVAPVDPTPPVESGTYDKLTNQLMINAFYTAAATVGVDGWDWISRAGLTGMAASDAARNQVYTGPKVEDMAGLSGGEQDALKVALGLPLEKSKPKSGNPTYPGLTNQEMLDAMDRAARGFGQTGLDWVRITGMTYITTPADNLNRPYAGPPFKEIPNLSDAQQRAVRRFALPFIN